MFVCSCLATGTVSGIVDFFITRFAFFFGAKIVVWSMPLEMADIAKDVSDL